MKPYFKYIGPLLLGGLIIFLFINISIEKMPTINLHTGDEIQSMAKVNMGAAKYLFYRHMFVNVITH